MVGVVTQAKALEMAIQVNLDLVEVSPQAEPPVCKILNYGKYKYEQQKKKNEAKKNQKTTQLKEVQFRPMIAENDLNIKCRDIRKFLENGDKVKVVLRLRGREMSNIELARNILTRVQENCKDISKIESQTKMEGRQMILVLAPVSTKV